MMDSIHQISANIMKINIKFAYVGQIQLEKQVVPESLHPLTAKDNRNSVLAQTNSDDIQSIDSSFMYSGIQIVKQTAFFFYDPENVLNFY